MKEQAIVCKKKFNNKWKIRAGGWTHKSNLLLLKGLLLRYVFVNMKNCNCKLYAVSVHNICSVVHQTIRMKRMRGWMYISIGSFLILYLWQRVLKTTGTNFGIDENLPSTTTTTNKKNNESQVKRPLKATTKYNTQHTTLNSGSYSVYGCGFAKLFDPTNSESNEPNIISQRVRCGCANERKTYFWHSFALSTKYFSAAKLWCFVCVCHCETRVSFIYL